MYKPNYTTDVSVGRYLNGLVKLQPSSERSIYWEESDILLGSVVDGDLFFAKQDPEPRSHPADDSQDETRSFKHTPLSHSQPNALVTIF